MRIDDPYTILEVEPTASPETIKKAYRRLARTWHPDKNSDPQAAERFKEVAAAWAILSDPEARRRHALQQGRIDHGEFPEQFMEDLANAIDRAENWIRDSVLPHYARFSRGRNAEMAARLWIDREELAEPHVLPPSSWWKQRSTRALAKRTIVTVLMDPSREGTVVLRGQGFFEVAIMPFALWHGGVREPRDLDATVLQMLLARYAQLAGLMGMNPEDPEGTLAHARSLDSAIVSARWNRIALWALVAGIFGFLLLAGYNRW